MNDKLTQLSKEIFVITDSNLKLIQDSMKFIKQEIDNLNRELSLLETRKNIVRNMPFIRMFSVILYTFSVIISPPLTKIPLLVLLILLQCVIEWFVKLTIGTKKQAEIDGNRIIQSLEIKEALLKEYEEEMKLYIEKTICKELTYNDDEKVTIKPIDRSLDDTNVKTSSLSRCLKK